jgi:hypothetical protein
VVLTLDGPPGVELAVSGGVVVPITRRASLELGSTWRVEAGVVLDRWHLRGAFSTTFHPAAEFEVQDTDGGVFTAGDLSLHRLGGTAAWRAPIGPIFVGAYGEIGVTLFAAPITEDMAEDVLRRWDALLPASALGVHLGLGPTVSVEVVRGQAWIELTVGAGYESAQGVGLRLEGRLGVTAAL